MNGETEAVFEAEANSVKDLTITVVYDNNPYKEGLETAWGFACLITGAEKSILFDTGRDGSLLGNMQKLAIEPNSIHTVVLSHSHPDHTGGLGSFLEQNRNVTVYLPASFPEELKDNVQGSGAKMVEVDERLEICKNVHSTGQLGRWIKEQSLIVRADKGLVVVTGCAHPGIVKIVSTVRAMLNNDVLLLLGGFHLEWASRGRIEKIISAFEQSNVRYVGPCHCTGHKAGEGFEKRFGPNYIRTGAGKTIAVADLR